MSFEKCHLLIPQHFFKNHKILRKMTFVQNLCVWVWMCVSMCVFFFSKVRKLLARWRLQNLCVWVWMSLCVFWFQMSENSLARWLLRTLFHTATQNSFAKWLLRIFFPAKELWADKFWPLHMGICVWECGCECRCLCVCVCFMCV